MPDHIVEVMPDYLLEVVTVAPVIDVTATGPQGAKGETGLPGMVRVNHGTDPDTDRPVGANIVLWVGSVEPVNADPTQDLIVWTT